MIKLLLISAALLSSCTSQSRSIAVLAYGSLINEPSRGGYTLNITQAFKPADFSMPISMRRHSGIGTQNERITAVIDKNQGHPKAVYFAIMDFSELKAARENLSYREGSKGKLTHIYYIKKNLPNLKTETPITGAPDWYISKAQGKGPYIKDVELLDETAKNIALWAENKGFSAVIWASYPPNLATEKEAAQKLINAGGDSNLYKNTVGYINQLPHKAETAFEKAVIGGPEALKKFTNKN